MKRQNLNLIHKALLVLLVSLFLITLTSTTSYATDYYVDATGGDDSNDGLSPEEAWKTISKVNSMNYNSGDSILFKRGETWNDGIVVRSSGSSGQEITFGAYGEGDKPVLDLELAGDKSIGIRLEADYINIQDFEIIQVNGSAISTPHWESVTNSYINILRVDVKDCSYGPGISFNKGSDIYIGYCTVNVAGNNGIIFFGE